MICHVIARQDCTIFYHTIHMALLPHEGCAHMLDCEQAAFEQFVDTVYNTRTESTRFHVETTKDTRCFSTIPANRAK